MEFPYRCQLCGYTIESVDDRMFWHGIGNCVPICEVCWGAGEHSDGSPCLGCKGSGSPEVKPD